MFAKKNKDLPGDTVLIDVENLQNQPTQTQQVAPTETPNTTGTVNPNQTASFQTKSQQEGKKFSGTLSYEDILSQTTELTNIQKTDIDYLAEEAKLRSCLLYTSDAADDYLTV